MDGLEMEVTMTEEEVRRSLQEPDSASFSFTAVVAVPSTCTGQAGQKRAVNTFFLFTTASFIKTANCYSQSKVLTGGFDRSIGGAVSEPLMDCVGQKPAERLCS